MRNHFLAALLAALSTLASAAAHDHAAPAAHDHAGHDHGAQAGHDHPAEGPRGGALIELGKEEYHAELLLDEKTNQVTVVLLDSSASKDVAIDKPYLLVNIKDGRKPRQYKLTAKYPDRQQTTGPTPRFAAESPKLIADLHSDHVVARLSVVIGKKAYSAVLHHDHDHNHNGHAH